MKRHNPGSLPFRTLGLLLRVLPAAALFVSCASSYSLIDVSDANYSKCWLSHPDCGIVVSAAKQPLYEAGYRGYHKKSIDRHVAVVAVKIENNSHRSVSLDSSHAAFLDGSGNPLEVLGDPETVAHVLGGGRELRNDFAVYGFQQATLEPGAILSCLVALKTAGDPYFATYYLRLRADDRSVITDARF
jgi:hypothetical protein